MADTTTISTTPIVGFQTALLGVAVLGLAGYAAYRTILPLAPTRKKVRRVRK